MVNDSFGRIGTTRRKFTAQGAGELQGPSRIFTDDWKFALLWFLSISGVYPACLHYARRLCTTALFYLSRYTYTQLPLAARPRPFFPTSSPPSLWPIPDVLYKLVTAMKEDFGDVVTMSGDIHESCGMRRIGVDVYLGQSNIGHVPAGLLDMKAIMDVQRRRGEWVQCPLSHRGHRLYDLILDYIPTHHPGLNSFLPYDLCVGYRYLLASPSSQSPLPFPSLPHPLLKSTLPTTHPRLHLPYLPRLSSTRSPTTFSLTHPYSHTHPSLPSSSTVVDTPITVSTYDLHIYRVFTYARCMRVSIPRYSPLLRYVPSPFPHPFPSPTRRIPPSPHVAASSIPYAPTHSVSPRPSRLVPDPRPAPQTHLRRSIVIEGVVTAMHALLFIDEATHTSSRARALAADPLWLRFGAYRGA
ncbi:hypothetical protein R3P38DRAFT_3275028 [Favolaschia claudopus]|uniref:Uncharacterized protein n=1 Tax=Favolaschia claudopus TaxID=2862362 RepID=A0AAW0AX45_9AGAR